MSWYYAEEGLRIGPFDDDGFQRLVAEGRVRASTPVWREGMTSWAPYHEVAAVASDVTAPGGVSAGGTGFAYCSQCGRQFPTNDMIDYGGTWVCAGCKQTFFQRLHEGVAVGGLVGAEFHYGGFWIRFAAKFIDGIILGVAQMVVSMLGGAVAAVLGEAAFVMTFLMIILQYAFAICYATFFVGRFAATPGKMACGLRVIVSDGSRVSYLRAFARYWADLLSTFTLFIGYIMAAFDREKRALHDHICNTRVIRK